MKKKSIILSTILLAILMISIGIGLDLSKIIKLVKGQVENIATTSVMLQHNRNELDQTRSQSLEQQLDLQPLAV